MIIQPKTAYLWLKRGFFLWTWRGSPGNWTVSGHKLTPAWLFYDIVTISFGYTYNRSRQCFIVLNIDGRPVPPFSICKIFFNLVKPWHCFLCHNFFSTTSSENKRYSNPFRVKFANFLQFLECSHTSRLEWNITNKCHI